MKTDVETLRKAFLQATDAAKIACANEQTAREHGVGTPELDAERADAVRRCLRAQSDYIDALRHRDGVRRSRQ